MKYRYQNIWRKVLYAVAVPQLLMLGACTRDDLNWLVGSPISVTATAEQPDTRSGANSNIQTTLFESGATLNAYYNISGGAAIGKTPTTLTASAPDGGKNRLTPDVQPYYPQTDNVDIFALYPPTEVNKESTSFTVQSDQSTDDAYKLSDLMWAGKTQQPRITGDVALTFRHKMAKMVLTITGTDNVLIQEVRLVNTVRTVNLPTLSAATVVADNLGTLATESDAEKKKILVAKSEETYTLGKSGGSTQLTGAVLFPPQTIKANFLEIVTNFGTTYFSTDKVFVGGAQYTANLKVTRQDIGFVTTIKDWEANDGSIAIPPGSSAGLYIKAIPDTMYNGHAIEPKLFIQYTPNDNLGDGISGTYDLVAGEDYEAEYFNNTNQGTAMVIITGKASSSRPTVLANVIGGLKAMTSFEITAAKGDISYNSATLSVPYQYNTVIKGFDLEKHGGDGQFTYKSTKENIATVSRTGVVTIRNVGTTEIKAYMDDTGNYTADSAKYTLTITPRKIKEAVTKKEMTVELAGTSFPYNGAAYRPAAIVKDKGRLLQENKHYTYEVTNNTAAGINTAKVTIRGMGNYSSATADTVVLPFSIVQQQAVISMSNSAVTIAKGTGFTYQRRGTSTYGTVKYRSSDASYATVDADGVVTGVKATTTTPVTITAYVEADASANHGWTAAQEVSYQVTVVETNWEYHYSASNQIQSWTCPLTGTYKLEAMGAQGATTNAYSGGRGAHVAGQVRIQKGQVLYIYLGQEGTVQKGSGNTYTFNGGGYYAGSNADDKDANRFTAGGGATDFALVYDASWSSDNHLYSRIIVAGGGGGALYYSSPVYCGAGGAGGAYVGEDGIGGSLPGKGGTLVAGGGVTASDDNNNTGSGGNAGSFGKGGHYTGSESAGCGGGGWYGGGSGQANGRKGAGGGGSSFIYNTANIDATTNTSAASFKYRSKLKTPSSGNYFDPETLEITAVTLVEGGSSDVNGQARITYMGDEE